MRSTQQLCFELMLHTAIPSVWEASTLAPPAYQLTKQVITPSNSCNQSNQPWSSELPQMLPLAPESPPTQLGAHLPAITVTSCSWCGRATIIGEAWLQGGGMLQPFLKRAVFWDRRGSFGSCTPERYVDEGLA